MLTYIDVKFNFDSVRLGLSSSANILQIADVALLVPAVVLTLETSEVSAILVFSTKTTQPRPRVFSVNGALTVEGAFLASFPR